MDQVLVELYDTCMARVRKDGPAYQKALSRWVAVKPSGALDLEDAADPRVYEWGLLAFAAGVRLGLGLCVGLEELEPEELL